ncbi:hypothetical protein BDZ97DRAFT_1902185 [Flammula alnicola]|nr:hypothetical protein BDZ97DRAFT_1902185 [Flammula alnicola]
MAPKSLSNFKSVIQTRNTNKASHPGKVVNDAKPKRRSHQEMEKVRADETRMRQEKEQDEVQKIKLAADVEDRLRKEDIDRRASNRHATGQAQYRPAPTAPPTDADNAGSGANRGKSTQHTNIFSSLPAVCLAPKPTDPVDIEDSDASSDEYIPLSVDADEGESEVDESDLEVEEKGDEPKQSKKGKKTKPGRADISAIRRVGSASLTVTARSDGKRKAYDGGVLDLPAKTKKKAKSLNQASSGALLPGWDSSTSRVSASHTQSAEEDDSMVRLGGFIGDEETDDVERKALSGLKDSKKKVLLNSIKISDSQPMAQRTKKAQRGGAAKWNLNHLPAGTRDVFTASLRVQELVNIVFPGEQYIVMDDDVWCGLIGYRLSNWRNGFYTYASEAVKKYLDANDEMFPKGPDDIAEFIELFTEIQGNPPTAPFHWREWDSDEETGKITKKGRLQNELIIYTLAHAYFSDYEEVPDPRDLDESELPGGALILSLQAVEHAFKFWKTGTFTEDNTTAAHFSGDNYGDNVRRKPGPDGRMRDVLVLNAGQYKATVRNLAVESHWVPIFEAVNNILDSTRWKKKGRSKSASSRASSEIAVDNVSEYILVSDDD